MFCSCGQEIFADANFCPKCGRSLQAASAVEEAPTPSREGSDLWHLHTYEWTGQCPNCQTVHTFENALCPNDEGPLVVAFNVGKSNPFKFFDFPMQTAHLRCSTGCDYNANNLRCVQCGKVVTGKHIRFEMPPAPNKLYQAYYLGWFALLSGGSVCSGLYAMSQISQVDSYVGLFFSVFNPLVLFAYMVWMSWWWKLQTSLDFERKNRR